MHGFGVVTVLWVQGVQVLLAPPRSELRYVFERRILSDSAAWVCKSAV
jgi:hypothetical protein